MSKEIRFDGRVAIVTGAGQGLGRSHALLLASRGAKVVVNDLGGSTDGQGKSSEAADRVVEEIKQTGGEAVANYDSVEEGDAIVGTAIEAFGRVDIVVNNAGILRDKSFKNMTDADWEIIFRVHNFGAYKVTKAAWPHLTERGYGRVVFTTSSAGIYGNFGQTNYGSAKLSLVGFANTLALEGQRKNILVNTIAPFAASRLTEGLLPPAVFDSLRPEYVSPLVAYLCSEDNDRTGGVFEVGGGFYSSLRWERTLGKTFRLGREVTPELLKDHWIEIEDFSESEHIGSVMESLGPIIKNVEAGPTKGGNEYIDVDLALGAKLPTTEASYDEKDLALYALGVGAGGDPQDAAGLRYVYEGASSGMKAIPTFAVIPGCNVVLQLAKEGKTAPGMNYGLDRLLHGEQYIELTRPLPLSAKLRHEAHIDQIWDKGKGALVVTQINSYDEDGELLIRNDMTAFVRGAGGWGGDRGPTEPANVPPGREPDIVVEDEIPAHQALLYRLSGDWNPLHADPGFAKAFGFDKPILHGLCTFGFAGRRVIEQFAPEGNPDFFRSIKVRFADNVFPGETLVTEMWKESDQRILFRCKVKERDSIVISNAAVELFEELPKPKEKKPATDSAVDGTSDVVPTAADVVAAVDEFVRQHPEIAEKAQTVFQLKLKEPESVWTIDLKASGAGPGETAKPDCTLELSERDYLSLQRGEADPMKLFTSGKLKVSGDMMATGKLEALGDMPFDLVLEKAAARAAGGGEEGQVHGAPTAVEKKEAFAPRIFEALGARFDERPGLTFEVGAVYQFHVRDPDANFVVDLKNEPPAFKTGETDGATTTLVISDADLAALARGDATPERLFQQGRLRVDGDVRPARRLTFLGGLI